MEMNRIFDRNKNPTIRFQHSNEARMKISCQRWNKRLSKRRSPCTGHLGMRIESVGICIEIVSRNQAPRTRNPEYSAMTFPPKVIYFHVVATTTTTTKAAARTRSGSTDCLKRDMLLISLRGTFSLVSLNGCMACKKNLHRYWEIVTVMRNDSCVQRCLTVLTVNFHRCFDRVPVYSLYT